MPPRNEHERLPRPARVPLDYPDLPTYKADVLRQFRAERTDSLRASYAALLENFEIRKAYTRAHELRIEAAREILRERGEDV